MSDAKVFEGIDWSRGTDHGYHVVTIGPDATQEDVQAFRDAYDLGCAWSEAEAAAKANGWWLTSLVEVRDGQWQAWAQGRPMAHDEDWDAADGSTPAAALRALAARLRERAG